MDYIVDEEVYAIETVSSHTEYLRNTSCQHNSESVAMHVAKSNNTDIRMDEVEPKRAYMTYTYQDKVRFFKLMFERVLSASAAAKQLGILVRSAQRWALQYEKDPESIFKKRKNNDRPRILHEEHKKVILECVDENPSIVLEQLMEQLLQRFQGLKVSKATLHRFVKNECNLSLKKARFQPVDRNSEAKIQERLDWVRRWDMADIDFRKNCVFLDESAFHINMKRSMAWSKKGSSAVVTVPKTGARTTTILGAISASGIIKCSLRLPQPPAKKRKRAGHSEVVSKGTITGHYLSFLKATMDEMDKYEYMKGHHLVMDNAPIHKAEDIFKYIESRGYRCAYLPSYSPELNPIEQFWSVVKSKVKRNRFLESETLMTRISEASNSLRLSDFEGFISHSYRCLDNCRNGEQL
ncbi:hypothetical protein VTP01DRAFT_783 [Rhizomucor pusillus]|uniref:uncharacterized protein n=1 Tax=Rhizomucor pusillus TaxID=4840 RepID=UPI0037436C51